MLPLSVHWNARSLWTDIEFVANVVNSDSIVYRSHKRLFMQFFSPSGFLSVSFDFCQSNNQKSITRSMHPSDLKKIGTRVDIWKYQSLIFCATEISTFLVRCWEILVTCIPFLFFWLFHCRARPPVSLHAAAAFLFQPLSLEVSN